MYKAINGWNRETMKAQIRKYNNGTKSTFTNVDTDGCAYRTTGGNHCGVGCFIPAELIGAYGNSADFVADLLNKMVEKGNSIDWIPLEAEAMTDFQEVHDNCEGNIHAAYDKWIDENVL